ncbi:MAG: DUF1572 domain-containing protein [Crocinitomicaceae bacterium]
METKNNQLALQIAKHMHDVHFGGNWTVSNVKETLSNIHWNEALVQKENVNSIATLTYHINYFVGVALNYLQSGKLEGDDKLSFNHPPIHSEEDWNMMTAHYLIQVEELVEEIKKLDDATLFLDFGDSKYGNYFRNLIGIVEHTHYHLGQINLLRKLNRAEK